MPLSTAKLGASTLAAATLVASMGCQARNPPNVGQQPAAARASVGRALEATSTPTDAHAKHAAVNIGCDTCHPCGGALQIVDDIRYPGGTTTAGAQVVRGSGSTPTTCQVGCHAPLGAPPHAVTWTAGSQACTDCHEQLISTGVASAHFDPSSSSSSCLNCHDVSRHTSGTVRLTTGDAFDSGCIACHAGNGHTLGARTPPLLVGWDDLVSGDFHGDRQGTCRFDVLDPNGVRSTGKGGLACPAGQPQPPSALRITPHSGLAWTCDLETVDAAGARIGAIATGQPCPSGTILNGSCNDANRAACYPTTLVTRGFGGTLAAPFTRGQSAMGCKTCHDGHSSANAFLFASTVNGVTIPPATITRAGVGAQALCNACHVGDRHEMCKACHRETWTTDGEYSWFEGAVVDPAPDGSACFYCHGHEGLLRMDVATPAYPTSGHPFGLAGVSKAQPACTHCHSSWAPPPTEYAPPVLVQGPTVTGVSATAATVSWTTDELATSYVEYGVGTAGFVAGDDGVIQLHAVTLTDLTPETTYVWRVRTSDRFRNVTESVLQAFKTLSTGAVPPPDLAPVNASVRVGTYTTTAQLVWYPVTAPSGTAVEYEVQLASDAAFTYLVNAVFSGPGVPGLTVGDSGWVSGAPAAAGGRPALSQPATLTNIPQDTCLEIVPNVYYWRVRARDQAGNVSDWSAPGSFGVFAGDPWC